MTFTTKITTVKRLMFHYVNSAFIASVAMFLSKSELFINPEISVLLTDYFSFIFAISISPINLLIIIRSSTIFFLNV